MVRVSACHAEGREFEPRRSRHLIKNSTLRGVFCFMFWMIRGENSTKQSFVLEFGASELRLESFALCFQHNAKLGIAVTRERARQASSVPPLLKESFWTLFLLLIPELTTYGRSLYLLCVFLQYFVCSYTKNVTFSHIFLLRKQTQ